MLLIPTYTARSAIHGIGVFAAVDIPAGTIIWRMHPDVDWHISPKDLKRFPQPYRERLDRYSYLSEEGEYIFCGDNAKYMNHSSDPNCDDSGMYTVAKRNIAAGEELTCDYTTFDSKSAADHPTSVFPEERVKTVSMR